MPQYDDIKEMKIKLNANLKNNQLQRNDKMRIVEKIKKVDCNLFQKDSLKNIRESQNLNFKNKKLETNIIRINSFRLILCIILFLPVISSSSFIINIKTKSIGTFKICKCGSIPPYTISEEGIQIILGQNINGYNTYRSIDNYIIIESIAVNVHNIKLSWNVKPSSLHGFFQGCDEIESIDFTYFDMDNFEDMSHLFDSCTSLKNINYFSPDSAVDMSYIFHNCISLVTINYKNVYANKVVNMDHMFYNCSSLNSISLIYYNTQNVEKNGLNEMFDDCNSLKKENIITNDQRILKEFDNKNNN